MVLGRKLKYISLKDATTAGETEMRMCQAGTYIIVFYCVYCKCCALNIGMVIGMYS